MVLTLLILNVCHWAGDFSHLSTAWMLDAKRFGKPLLPILAHAGVHTSLFFIAIFALHDFDNAVIAAAIQLPTHFTIDVLKGKMNVWFPKLLSMENKFHWWVFGADQMLHQTVIIGTASLVCR
ncbi:MAG: DUF3307 domain-containing protein [Bacteroidia bacterium]|nr:DUF3307 domain-containing protein [Bacteroidia bacterium]